MTKRPDNDKRLELLKSLRRIWALVRKEFQQISRHRRNFGILLVAPVVQLLVFGSASRLDVRDVKTVVVDLDHSVLSRTIVDAFSRSGYFRIVAMLPSYNAVDAYMERGEAVMAILIPPDLERLAKGGQTAQVGVLIDGVNTTTAGTVSGYAEAVLRRVSQDILAERVNRMQGLLYSASNRLLVPTVVDAERAWFNKNLDSKDFFIPGVVVLILLSMSTILTSVVVVREKEVGTIEQLMVTPITRFEMIAGKLIPSFMLQIGILLLVTPLAFVIYEIPFRGSFLFFLATSFIFLSVSSGIGLTISTFCNTQQQAVLTSFMFLQPAVLLSGYAFPIENMPTVVQYITYLNPLRYFITIVRGVFLKGSGIYTLWPELVPLFFMACFYVWLAAVLFKKRMD